MKNVIKNIITIVFLFSFVVSATDKKIEIGIDEQLGSKIPLNLKFKDETGREVAIKDLVDRPTVFAFVYYECPGICSPLMSSIADVINRTDMVAGENYNVVLVSMDEKENSQLAYDKKRNYLKLLDKKIPESSWRFLTGDSASIKQLADAEGFYFKRDGTQFIHSGALIFVNKDGKICRYLFPGYTDRKGYSILPFDFKMAIVETSEGKTIPTVANVLQYCFSYDPEGKTYVLNFTRIFGAGILILVAVFVVFITAKPKKDRKTR